MKACCLLPALLLLSPLGWTDTLTVDDDGGADFTEISAAIAAASSGDLILVEPGSYADFTLTVDLTVLGTAPGVAVGSGSRISSIGANRRAVLADLSLLDLSVTNNAGAVILDGLEFPDGAGGSSLGLFLNVLNSPDVRLHECSVNEGASFAANRNAMSSNDSRVEVVSSWLAADRGAGEGNSGPVGVLASAGSRLHVAATSVLGGTGADGNFATCGSFLSIPGGDGSPAFSISNPSELFLMGSIFDTVRGGGGGIGDKCFCDGSAASGLQVAGSARYSGVSLAGGSTLCFGDAPPTSGSGTIVEASPADPYLTKQFVPSGGSQVRFVVHGVPGDSVLLYLGRSPIVQPVAGFDIEQLSTRERTFPLGSIGATGNATFLLTVPGNLPQGFAFFAQAEVISGASSFHTNSLPIVLR